MPLTDIDQSRLEVAKKMGADHVVRVTSKDPLDLAQAVEDAVGDKVDITMECSGAEASTQAAIYVSINLHVCTYGPWLLGDYTLA